VSAALGEFVPDRGPLLKVLNRLYDQLENNTGRYRGRRNPQDQNLFDYVVHFHDGKRWQTLRFSVDDCLATDYLVVVAVDHQFGTR